MWIELAPDLCEYDRQLLDVQAEDTSSPSEKHTKAIVRWRTLGIDPAIGIESVMRGSMADEIVVVQPPPESPTITMCLYLSQPNARTNFTR